MRECIFRKKRFVRLPREGLVAFIIRGNAYVAYEMLAVPSAVTCAAGLLVFVAAAFGAIAIPPGDDRQFLTWAGLPGTLGLVTMLFCARPRP